MATIYTDETRTYYYHPHDGKADADCARCGTKLDMPHHRCTGCGELFDWNQCFNMRDLCTNCCPDCD